MAMPAHLQIAYARKELAFEQWRKSGYRNIAAYTRFIHWYKVCQSDIPYTEYI